MRPMSILSCIGRVKRTNPDRPAWTSDYVFEGYVGDRSGSMRSMGYAPQSSTRKFIEDKRAKAWLNTGTNSYLTCVTFDDKAEVVFSKDTNKITDNDIYRAITSMKPRGLTRFTDTAYETLSDLINRAKKKKAEFRYETRRLQPSITISVAFMTDGDDNKSIRDPSDLAALIQELDDSDFKGMVMFMAANMNSSTIGKQYGIHPENCIDFSSNSDGIENVLRSASNAMTRVSSGMSSGFSQLERTASQAPSHGIQRVYSTRLVRSNSIISTNNKPNIGYSSDEDISQRSNTSSV